MRLYAQAQRHSLLNVSIHAPGRGATIAGRAELYVLERFNSRTREGCDLCVGGLSAFFCVFQFTHPGGVRPRDATKLATQVRVSIHAPGRGATYRTVLDSPHHRIVSIHAPGRGATQGTNQQDDEQEFQFTHPGGVRQGVVTQVSDLTCVSIHAPGRGATSDGCDHRTMSSSSFNSRTREGCDSFPRCGF